MSYPVVVLSDHFNCNRTYIVGDWILNGCTRFHVDQIDSICFNHRVPDEMKEQVLDYISKFDNSKLINSIGSNYVHVRELIALNGVGHEYLYKDRTPLVRLAVAQAGGYLQELSKDDTYAVRAEVARQGVALETLVHDLISNVVIEVAKHNYRPDIIIGRGHPAAIMALCQFEEHHEEIFEKFPKNSFILCKLIQCGFDPERLKDSEFDSVRYEVALKGVNLENYVYDPCSYVRIATANHGVGLEYLVNDEDCNVREAVAEQGYGLEQLIKDDNMIVQAALARQGYRLDILENSRWIAVRELVKQYREVGALLS